MTAVSDFAQAFDHARQLQARGSRIKAEHKYRELLARGENRELVLRALVDLYMETRRPDDVVATLVALTEEVPDRLFYHARLVNLLDGLGRTDQAIAHYERLLQRQPQTADAHYNLALLYKKEKRYREAKEAYEEAIRLGIDRVQEVYSNLGVLYSEMHKPEQAAEMQERALELEPDYIPALINRGGLFEEAGDRESAVEFYRRILSKEPGHSGALGRLVHAGRVTDPDEPLLRSIDDAIDAAQTDAAAREELLFARGKAMDDLGRYDQAFEAYVAANQLGKGRTAAYNRRATEQGFDRLIETLDAEWISDAASESSASPIFICGMFRSGSTLVEQILSTHPSITAGGELDCLPWLIARRHSPFPERARSASSEELRQTGDEYLARVRGFFPGAEYVTDKRPENFLYLGLVMALFPAARVVHTRRSAADNCLSIYFQQLGQLSYATDLEDTAHYYAQHERLMGHWERCFAKNIFTVDYDELVRSPEPVLRRLLDFLGLEWSDRCLDFKKSDSVVKTASLWQVREELHTQSSGRWRNYAPFIRNLEGPWRTQGPETSGQIARS